MMKFFSNSILFFQPQTTACWWMLASHPNNCFPGSRDQKTPETSVQLSFANQEGKLVGSIFSRPSGGTPASRLNNWVQLPQEILPTPCSSSTLNPTSCFCSDNFNVHDLDYINSSVATWVFTRRYTVIGYLKGKNTTKWVQLPQETVLAP